VETAISSLSRWSKRASPSMSRMSRFALFGRRLVVCPLRYVRGIELVSPFISLSRSWVRRADSSSRDSSASSSAFARPMIPGTFSVPLLWSPSWPPPMICGSSGVPDFLNRRPIPFGPYILLALRVRRSIPRSCVSSVKAPPAWQASVWKMIDELRLWVVVASSLIG